MRLKRTQFAFETIKRPMTHAERRRQRRRPLELTHSTKIECSKFAFFVRLRRARKENEADKKQMKLANEAKKKTKNKKKNNFVLNLFVFFLPFLRQFRLHLRQTKPRTKVKEERKIRKKNNFFIKIAQIILCSVCICFLLASTRNATPSHFSFLSATILFIATRNAKIIIKKTEQNERQATKLSHTYFSSHFYIYLFSHFAFCVLCHALRIYASIVTEKVVAAVFIRRSCVKCVRCRSLSPKQMWNCEMPKNIND